MKNYKLTIQYDGSRYKGWQLLKNEENTIQGKMQNALSKLVSESVEVIGSGRTDAGVHALGQVANVHLDEKVLREELKKKGLSNLQEYLNRFLPEDIAVTAVEEVAERFHARFGAVRKTYRYRIHVSEIPNVFERKYVYTYLDYPLDVKRMREAAGHLLGTHDFMSVCANKHMKKSTVRTIEAIEIKEIMDEKREKIREIAIDFTGDGFLQNMIRILTGTLIEVGSGRRSPDSITELLAAKDRAKAGYTAPPQGLVLVSVEYE